MQIPPLILASASPRRTQLLRQLEWPFEVLPARTEESAAEHLTPCEITLLNAYRKARAVAKGHPDCLVLGADTVVALGLELFGKPATLQEAHGMLSRLAGRVHHVITGVCLIHLRGHRQVLFTESTRVAFRKLDAVSIRRYLSLVNVLDKAGAYAIQEHGEMIIDDITGSYSNVVGLPMERLYEVLQQWPQEHEEGPTAK